MSDRGAGNSSLTSPRLLVDLLEGCRSDLKIPEQGRKRTDLIDTAHGETSGANSAFPAHSERDATEQHVKELLTTQDIGIAYTHQGLE
jgi:hypothetical protein